MNAHRSCVHYPCSMVDSCHLLPVPLIPCHSSPPHQRFLTCIQSLFPLLFFLPALPILVSFLPPPTLVLTQNRSMALCTSSNLQIFKHKHLDLSPSLFLVHHIADRRHLAGPIFLSLIDCEACWSGLRLLLPINTQRTRPCALSLTTPLIPIHCVIASLFGLRNLLSRFQIDDHRNVSTICRFVDEACCRHGSAQVFTK